MIGLSWFRVGDDTPQCFMWRVTPISKLTSAGTSAPLLPILEHPNTAAVSSLPLVSSSPVLLTDTTSMILTSPDTLLPGGSGILLVARG